MNDIAQLNRLRFGEMLRNWRIRQGWTQYTPSEWAKAVGFRTISYGNWSVIESGKSGELRHASFLQLEEMFRRLDQKDYGAIADLTTRERVTGAEPIRHPDGRPWDAIDLIRHYLGRLDTPAELQHQQPPQLSQKMLRALCGRWRRVALDHAAKAANRIQALDSLVATVPADHRDRFRELLAGWDYQPTELAALWITADDYRPGDWITRWITAND